MKFRPIYSLSILPVMIAVAMPFAIANPNSDGLRLAQTTEESPASKKGGRSGRLQKMIETLNLSEDQVQQLKAIHGESRDDREKGFETLRNEVNTMRNLVSQSASTSELRAQHQKIQALKQDMSERRFEKMLQMYEVLTPEQRKTFAEKMKMRHGRKGRFGRGRGRGHQDKGGELQSMLTF